MAFFKKVIIQSVCILMGDLILNDQIYKQTLIPLSSVGSTIIFKNRFYGQSTNFTTDPDELKKEKTRLRSK